MLVDLVDPTVVGIVVVSGLIVGVAIFLVIAVMVERRRFIERKEAMFADWDSVVESEKGALAALREGERTFLLHGRTETDVEHVKEAKEIYEDELSPDHLARHEAAYLGGEPCKYS